MREDGAFLPDLRQVRTIALKEFMDNVRGKWILVLSALFVLLALVVSAYGGVETGQGAGIRGFRATSLGIMGLVSSFVPILGLMASYATIAGEREQGSLQLLLTMPVTRAEVLVGKLLGLGTVLAVAILVGLGSAGVVIAASAGTEGWGAYLALVGATLLLAFAFVSLGILFSSFASKRSTAIALAVFLWFFFTIIWSLLVLGLAAAAGITFNLQGGAFSMPGWLWALDLVNPAEEVGALTSAAFGITEFMGFGFVYPAWATPLSMAGALALWVALPHLLAQLRLRRLDL